MTADASSGVENGRRPMRGPNASREQNAIEGLRFSKMVAGIISLRSKVRRLARCGNCVNLAPFISASLKSYRIRFALFRFTTGVIDSPGSLLCRRTKTFLLKSSRIDLSTRTMSVDMQICPFYE
jgi:hypothetical protein